MNRATSEYIREHKDKYVVKQNSTYKLKKPLLTCGKNSAGDELQDILYNVPELFID